MGKRENGEKEKGKREKGNKTRLISIVSNPIKVEVVVVVIVVFVKRPRNFFI